MGIPLELIEVERERVQELRTRFGIAKAFQDELDERTRGHVLEFANTTIRQMVSDHRYGLVARVAGWVRTATGHKGFIDQLGADDHLSAFRAKSREEEYQPGLGHGVIDPFAHLFPGVPSGAAPGPADLERIRAQLVSGAANVLENAELVRGHLDGGGVSGFDPSLTGSGAVEARGRVASGSFRGVARRRAAKSVGTRPIPDLLTSRTYGSYR